MVTKNYPLNIRYYCHECNCFIQVGRTKQGFPEVSAPKGTPMVKYVAHLICGHTVKFGHTRMINAYDVQMKVKLGRWQPVVPTDTITPPLDLNQRHQLIRGGELREVPSLHLSLQPTPELPSA